MIRSVTRISAASPRGFFAGLALVLIIVSVGSGCATARRDGPGFAVEAPAAQRVAALAGALVALAPAGAGGEGAVRVEATRIAAVALATTDELRAKWRPIGPALLNNMLVNMRYRPRGLCYEWTNDLLEPLEGLGLAGFELHWGTSFWGDRLKEHNAIVITARGRPFGEGLVLDAWRFGGRLVWVRVREDEQYPWRGLTVAELTQFRPVARAAK
jgi:hypothetical protein